MKDLKYQRNYCENEIMIRAIQVHVGLWTKDLRKWIIDIRTTTN